MIEQTNYKDRPAYSLTTHKMQVMILPEDGGKLASIKDGRREYLAQSPGEKYRRLFPESDYVLSECSGFDDMFPTIDPVVSAWQGLEGARYLDHGEVCRYPMEMVVNDDILKLTFVSHELPVVFEKQVHGDCATGDIHIHYSLKNISDVSIPYIWAAHCMLQGDPDGRLILPFRSDAPIHTMFGRQLERDRMEPFSKEGESYKYYFVNQASYGKIGFQYGDGSAFWMIYPEQIVKYLGIWINNGSFKGMYNIGLEPCTAPYDRPDIAEREGVGSYINPKETISFSLTISLTREEGAQ